MKQSQIERVSARTALAVGFCVTLGFWLYTGFSFTRRVESIQRDATEVASRYTRAQELLSTVRTQVLLSSVRVRDGLLNPDPPALMERRAQVESAYRVINMAIADYEPVIGGPSSGNDVARLSHEIDQFHITSLNVLAEAGTTRPEQVRDVLNRHIAPRREAALAISEEIQTLNRRAFIAQQGDIAAIHRLAESQSRRQLGFALVVGMGTLLLTSLYSGRLEARLRHQMERDARMSSELQQMAAKVITAQEEERRTISRELHDEVGQVLGAVRVELELAQHAIVAGTATDTTLSEAQTITDGALQTVRNLSQLLHPATLDDLGLTAALETALRGLERRYQIRGTLQQVDLPSRLPREVELAAYRIVQEGITNVGKHANATQCTIRLTQLIDRLLIEVEDDGVGFIEDIDRPIVARGLGLISIRERAMRLGGTFNIMSTPGQGTRLIVSLPEAVALA
jgi:signal transduction histidine kinase